MMKKIIFFLFCLFLFSCKKKCIHCTDTLIITSTAGRPGYPRYFRDEVDFCGQERRHFSEGSETHTEVYGPGDVITYYQTRTCEEEK